MTIETFNNLVATLPETGAKFKGTIKRSGGEITDNVTGLIYNDKQKDKFYLCHNDRRLTGSNAPNKQGYCYSWVVSPTNYERIDIEIECINNDYSIF